ARRLVIGRYEAVAVAHAAIMRGLYLVPHDKAVVRDAAFVDADGFNFAAHHEPVDPGPRPLDLAFEMAAAFGDARRLHHPCGHRGEPGFGQFVGAALERQTADEHAVKHRLLERHDVDGEFAGREHVVVGVFAGPAGEGDVHRIVAHARAGTVGGAV